MISSLTGELRRIDQDRIHVECGSMVFELLVPAADLSQLHASLGTSLTFHTILDLEGDPTRGNLAPRLIGFLRPQDKKFFQLFTTVKGIGPKKALRALSVPIGQIAQAIEAQDANELANLEGIGKRMAQQIVAELTGKVASFAGDSLPVAARSPVEEDAVLVCVRLGLARADAERLLDRVRQAYPSVETVDALSREMLRLRTAPL